LSYRYHIITIKMEQRIRIIVADDHMLFIDGLNLLMKEEPGFCIIDIANDGRELLDIIKKEVPDIILLDINMPKMNGIETAMRLRQSHPSVKIIMLSTYNDEHLIEKARQIGASGYLLKNSNKEELFQAIFLVSKGLVCFPYRPPKDENEFDLKDNFLKQFNITKREYEIIKLIKDNLTNQQIAGELNLSIYTVETHRKNIMHKLNLNTPAALIRFIIENNM